MKIYLLDTACDAAPDGWRFVTNQELAALPMPTAVVKARKAIVDLLQG